MAIPTGSSEYKRLPHPLGRVLKPLKDDRHFSRASSSCASKTCRRTRWLGIPLLALLAIGILPDAAHSSVVPSVQRGGSVRDVSVQRLYGLRRMFIVVKNSIDATFGDGRTPYGLLDSKAALDAALETIPEVERNDLVRKHLQALALWQEFGRVALAVLGPKYHDYGEGYRLWHDAFLTGVPLRIQADSATLARDDLAFRMASLGYAPKDIADVVNGRLSLHALDAARKMLMVGRTEREVTHYLEARYKPESVPSPTVVERPPLHASVKTEPTPTPPRRRSAAHRSIFDPAVVKYAEKYGVDPDLVRAVIRHESNWNPEARSRVGAIGLMQLMPGTARLLGVNPFDPLQNIEGGVKYLAGLLSLFGQNLEATLLGYIGGPLYAKSWLQGKTVQYGEVRTYVMNVKASYQKKDF